MKVAVLSGKGGAGKTFVSVNLAAAAGQAVYLDCDVEEPNGRLFFRPGEVVSHRVHSMLPLFDPQKCTGCRKCVDFCRFNALVYIKGAPLVFSEVCHSCGGCALVCPVGAVSEAPRPVGLVEEGRHKAVRVVTGILDYGEASGIPVIREVLKAGKGPEPLTVIDCPPGSACPVMESVSAADCCLLVAEPTAFGFHNFKMVWELVQLLGKPCGVVINKMDEPYLPLEEFCKEKHLPILMRIPFRQELARMAAGGSIAAEEDEETAAAFRGLLASVKTLGGERS